MITMSLQIIFNGPPVKRDMIFIQPPVKGDMIYV